ncbi:MAG TPA: pyridoxamine 5'-phosphate oxidase family protein [Amycolatopsis sp.]|nr:pyridoxamine 5'-phosphate oxidase family protein [Amycolatopsis sp.]
MNELRQLTRRECLRLLGSAQIGRLGFCEDALPTIRPVNFALHGTDIIVRTMAGGAISKVAGAVVAFEVDDIDAATHTGWSVVVIGKAEPVTQIDTLVTLADPVRRPWAPGERSCFLRIRVELVSGRRLTAAPDATAGMTPSRRGDRQ